MAMVHYTPDGMIWVRVGGNDYGETPENFALDYGSPPPALPAGITQRIYEPGKRHPLIADDNVMDGGPMPWPEGDAMIAAYPSLVAAKQARAPKPETPTLPPLKS